MTTWYYVNNQHSTLLKRKLKKSPNVPKPWRVLVGRLTKTTGINCATEEVLDNNGKLLVSEAAYLNFLKKEN